MKASVWSSSRILSRSGSAPSGPRSKTASPWTVAQIGAHSAPVVSLIAVGCKTVDEKRADYHTWRSERAADKGNYDTARKQEEKAEKARANIPTDKLP